MQIDPADSDHQDAPPDQPEPGREPDRADHRRPGSPPPGYVRCPMLGCGRLHSCPGLLVSVAGTDAPGQTLVMVEE